MRHKRLDQAIVTDDKGNVIFWTGDKKEQEHDVPGVKLEGLPNYKYVDRIDHKSVVVLLDPDGKFLYMYDLYDEPAALFKAEDLPK